MLAKLKQLTVTLIIALLWMGTSWLGLWDGVESQVYDLWFRLGGSKDPGEEVVIISIGEKSISQLGNLPWPRSLHAELLDRLREARVVAFDMVFDLPTDAVEDAKLAAAIAEHGGVVLGYSLGFEEVGKQWQEQQEMEFKLPLEEFLEGAAGIGYINMPTDPDNVVRRTIPAFPAAGKGTEELMPSFHLAAALAYLGKTPDDIGFEEENGKKKIAVGDKIIPVDSRWQVLVNFWGPAATFRTYEYVDVLEGRIPPGLFRNRICLVGPTSVLLHDYQQTPFVKGNVVQRGALPVPGVEIHASCLKSFLDQTYFQRVSRWGNAIFLLAVWLVTGLLTLRRGPWAGLAITLGIMGSIVAAAYGSWLYRQVWLDCASPLGLALVTYTGITAESYLLAERERQKTRALFSRYVSPHVVEELTAHPELVELGGKRQEVTVLFSDIRGFTSYSEGRTPEEVVKRLNEYLAAMTEVIFKHGGMIDKYMGDGIMAVFGAPVWQPDHARRAIAASMEMRERLKELNRRWAERGEHLFNIGIGLSSGPVVVGNIGSAQRMDYTAIGEDVNLASRLEGLNKEYGTQLILSDRTLKSLRESGVDVPWVFEELGEVLVRGFSEPVGIYTVR